MQQTTTYIQLITLIIWLIAGVIYVCNIYNFPKAQRAERFAYAAPVVSFVFHVVLFYIVVVAQNWGSSTPVNSLMFRQWSAVVRLHGGLAIGIKEAVAFYRQRLINQKGNKHGNHSKQY